MIELESTNKTMKNIIHRKALLEHQIEKAKKEELVNRIQTSTAGLKQKRDPEEVQKMQIIISANTFTTKPVKSSNTSISNDFYYFVINFPRTL